MLAGIAVGPHTPGFVADSGLASQMADIGVILLMFGVGMHFHPEELLRVWRVAVPGGAVQSALAVAAGWWCARRFGWSHGAAVVFGMALAVASTVVLTRMLVERDRLSTHEGRLGETRTTVTSSEHEATGPGARATVVIAGLGEVGMRVARGCAEIGMPVYAVDSRLEWIEELREQGLAAIFASMARGIRSRARLRRAWRGL